MRYASVCDGIGAAHVAWQPLGWECAWTSEIEPFPSAVVDERWKLKNVGDMTKLTEEQLQHEGPISLLVGGTPCQSFSVAGLRKGLEDPRGNLALRFTQLVGVLRPTWVVWENVPGVLSSGGGRDFGTFLGALAELGYGFAYRVLDAQWFGVAQRRRRVFVVGHLGDWRRAAAVLFERESVFGNPPTRGATGQGITSSLEGIAGNVSSKWAKGTGGPAGDECYNLVAFHPTQDPISSVDGSTHAMGCGSKGGCCTQAVAVAQGFTYSGYSNQPAWMTGDGTDCLPASGHSDGSHQAVGVVAFDTYNQDLNSQVTQSLRSSAGGGAYDRCVMYDGYNQIANEDISPSVRIGRDSGDCLVLPMAVRRLTPRECERLQGFPDDYTLVTYRNKPAADGPRYKALGNSMAVPVMRWIGERIATVDSLDGVPA
jgi:DNA (cytosine-5)-methyltransferase 1